jgi:hypothetical protein
VCTSAHDDGAVLEAAGPGASGARWYCRRSAAETGDGARTIKSLPWCVFGNAMTSRRLAAEASTAISRSKPVGATRERRVRVRATVGWG